MAEQEALPLVPGVNFSLSLNFIQQKNSERRSNPSEKT